MNELASLLRNGNDQTSFEGVWITPVAAALDGVTFDEAVWRPTDASRSLWEIALHTSAWTTWATHFLRGEDTAVTDWPAPPADPTPETWDADRTQLTESLAAFGVQISATPNDALFRPLTPDVAETVGFTGVLSILIHNAYHAGQITKLREQYVALNRAPAG